MRRTLRTAAGGFGGLGVPFVGVDELREVGVSSPAENPYAAAVGESSLWRFPAAAVREPSLWRILTAAVGESSLWRIPTAAVRAPSPVANPCGSC